VQFADNFSTLFDLLPIGAYRSTPEGKYLRANAALVALTGFRSESDLVNSVDLINGWYVETHRRAEFVAQVMRDGEVANFVSEIFRHETRERVWISENAHVVYDANDGTYFFEGTVENITDRVVAAQRLANSERRHRALMHKAQVAIAIVDTNGRVLFATAAIRELFGCEADDFVGQNIFDSMHPDDLATHRIEFANVALGRNTGRESVARHRHPDGSFRHLASLANDARDDPAINGIVLNWRDVTDATVAQHRLKDLAETDALTELTNRSHFEAFSAQLLERAKTSEQKLALYFVDLNRFKLVNDSHGHSVGDQVLQVIAARLKARSRPGDVLARIGGDEFGLLCAVESRQDALQRGAEWLRAIDTSVQIEGMRFELGASVGMSLFPDDGQTFAELLRHADLAMFRAKAQRTAAVESFTPAMAARARAQTAVATELHDAIKRGEIEPFFQPMVDLGNGQWRAVEALARWRHPTRGLLLPSEFIAAAEEQGVISEIGRTITETAIAQLAHWRKRFAPDLRLSINVAAQELRYDEYVTRLLDLIAAHGLPERTVTLEVTEGSLVESDTNVGQRIAALREGGVLIALDDLGVGYSTLEYFKRFPIDVVKVDKLFMAGVPTRRVDAAIVKALTTLARNLGVLVVAEGVERVEQASFALEAGCHLGQGYFYVAPKSVAEIDAMLASGKVQLPSPEAVRPSWERGALLR
jgi:diguanylate cyclase (GGDEF)-like protein/PAS domain S-box-containing protein